MSPSTFCVFPLDLLAVVFARLMNTGEVHAIHARERQSALQHPAESIHLIRFRNCAPKAVAGIIRPDQVFCMVTGSQSRQPFQYAYGGAAHRLTRDEFGSRTRQHAQSDVQATDP